MPEKPPRSLAKYAQEFALEWADELDQFAALKMEALGIPPERIGASAYQYGIPWCAFNPYEGIGGSVGSAGEINLDSGLLNPGLMKKFGRRADRAWRRASLDTRSETIIAHEYEEGNGHSHDEAIRRAPDTELPIGRAARELARRISEGHRGR